jgi:hypothetical protein
MINEDIWALGTADETDRAAIFKLRKSLNLVRTEELRGKLTEIHYEIAIPNLDQWNLTDTIQNAHKNFLKNKNDVTNINLL